MHTHWKHLTILLTAIMLLLGCRQPAPTATPTAVSLPAEAATTTTPLPPTATAVPSPAEAAPTTIPLTGPITDADAELSGLAWYGDWLILLPQYPTFATGGEDGLLFALPRADILAFLDGSLDTPLTPIEIPFSGNLGRELSRFEGFEAVTFAGNVAYLTVETSPGKMLGYLVSGQIAPDLSQFTLNLDAATPIEPQADSPNHTDETILLTDDTLITIYEASGLPDNPVAHRFGQDLQPLDTIGFPSIPYRVTDATAVDANGRFWVINYFFPGEGRLRPETDPILPASAQGATHRQFDQVERLLELQLTDGAITLTDTPPIQLSLIADARNWEGIVRLDDRGFLLVTDKFPETILAFVPNP